MEKNNLLIGIIGEISCASPTSAFQNFSRQGCVETYTNIFEKQNTNVIIIPYMHTNNQTIINNYISHIDGLLIPGGLDVTPELYNETKEKECGKTDIEYDNYCISLIKEAKKQKKAILGICRGAQLINVAFNGSLYQDQLLDERDNKEYNHTDLNNIDTSSHKILINKKSKLFKIFNKQVLDVNSLHHQSIKQVGKNLRLSALSLDGVVEAIESEDDSFVIGVQWHPETLYTKTNEMEPLFKAFINNC